MLTIARYGSTLGAAIAVVYRAIHVNIRQGVQPLA